MRKGTLGLPQETWRLATLNHVKAGTLHLNFLPLPHSVQHSDCHEAASDGQTSVSHIPALIMRWKQVRCQQEGGSYKSTSMTGLSIWRWQVRDVCFFLLIRGHCFLHLMGIPWAGGSLMLVGVTFARAWFLSQCNCSSLPNWQEPICDRYKTLSYQLQIFSWFVIFFSNMFMLFFKNN